ncbi:MAG TPA: TlpA disulfide reductase family protein [Bryobacteraceae bacterium]|nr:TlpA disulfide reductase family protein [Bryobacteraceae bacterium]
MNSVKADRILGALLALAVLGFGLTLRDVFEQRVIEAGDRAPSFSIKTDRGATVSNSSFGGKLLVLNFWATWCPPCVEEMPSLNQFASTFKDQGVVVLGVSIDRNQKAYKTFVERSQLTFPTAHDPEANISSEYGTFKWPETYVIDTNGKVVEKFIGPREWMSPETVRSIKAHL